MEVRVMLGYTLIGHGEPQTRAVVSIADYEENVTNFDVTYNGREYTCGNSFSVNVGDSIVINLTSTGSRVTNKINVGGTDVVSKQNAVATYTLEVTGSIDITYTKATSGSSFFATTTYTATVTDSTAVAGFEREITKGVALIGYGEPQTRAVVTITGSGKAPIGNEDVTHVTINGTTYNSAATVEVDVGTEISILIVAFDTAHGNLTIDGSNIDVTSTTTYTYTVETDITINMSSITPSGNVTITTDTGGPQVAYEINKGMTLVDGVAYEIGSSPVPVTITGTGGEDDCYCEIGGVKYYAATSDVETHSGDIIHLYTYRSSGSTIIIDGVTVGSASTNSYYWTVPSGISEVNIAMSSAGVKKITVTTA